MARSSYVDPRLLTPPSNGIMAAIPTDPGALPNYIDASMGELTVDRAAAKLLDIRTRMSQAWPRLVAKASAKKRSSRDMSLWNGAQWLLIDMEMKLARRLGELGVTDASGRPLQVPSLADLQRTMQVGRFAGVGNAEFGVVFGAVALWVLVALGITLSAAVAMWAGAQLVKSFSAAEITKLDAASQLVSCVASGNCSEDTLKVLNELKIKDPAKPEPASLPGWAKGAIAIGASVVGVLLVANLAPWLKRR